MRNKESNMKVSEIELTGGEIRVATRTDAYRVFVGNRHNDQAWHRDNYIAEYGDVEVEYDSEYNVWRVPAFAEERAAYSASKAIDCANWGCE